VTVRTALALVLLTGSAAAAPVGSLTADIDSDGTADKMVMDSNGDLLITTKKTGGDTIVLAPATRAVLSFGVVKGVPTIAVVTDKQVTVLRSPQSKWTVSTTVPVDVGLDADYTIVVEPRTDGVYMYESRIGSQRCDKQPGMAFARFLDGGVFRRLARPPTLIPDNAPVINAKPDPSPGREGGIYRARFASHEPGARNVSELPMPVELDDGKTQTAWREEMSTDGEGQYFNFVPRVGAAKAAQIRIVTGPKGSNRPQRIGVATATDAWHIDIPDGAPETAFVADLPTPVAGCVTLVLESTYGSDKGTTQIGELVVYAEGERTAGSETTLAHAIAEGTDVRVASQELARRGAAGVKAIEDELAKTKDHNARSKLFSALVGIKDPAAGPLLAQAASEGELQGAELVAAISALAGLGQGQVLHDIAAKGGTPIDARVAAVRALRPPAEKDLLVSLAGVGPREVRQATIEALMVLDVATLAAAAQAATKPNASGDLWRAVTRRARAHADERAAALTAMTGAITQSSDYERRYRLVDGIAALGDVTALKSLTALLKQLPTDDAEAIAFKQIAARAVAVNPRPDAFDLIVALAGDRDAGVRLAALSALAGASGGSEGAWHGAVGADGIDRLLTTSLYTDTWPEVRRFAAQMLGDRCVRPGPAAALKDSLARDHDLNVRGDALTALVQCKAGGSAELLAKLWDDTKAPLDLRRRAVDLTVSLADTTLGAKLVGKFTQWRGAALESEQALALAQNAAYAIGQLNPPGAAAALMAALDDAAFPEIVAAAATGLGLLGASCPATAVPKLKALTESDEQQIAAAARRAVAQCGH
jgi:hypothetical protein